jgi:hypothetical protein
VLRLGYEAIANRLNADSDAYPPPANHNGRERAGYWTPATVRTILANPKYTGYMVWNVRQGKSRKRDRSEWVWSPERTHPALITRDLWEQAAAVGAVTEGSRPGHGANPHPQTQRTYLLRSFVRCAVCGRRLIGKTKSGNTYYACPLDHADPRVAERYPDHPRGVLVREEVLHGAIEEFFAEHVFGPHRAELFHRNFDEAAVRAHAEHAERIASLEKRITAAEQAQRTLTRELGKLPADEAVATRLRAGIHEHFGELEAERLSLMAELEAAQATKQDAPEDPTLLDELPNLPLTLVEVAEDKQRDLFGAFSLDLTYDKRRHEADLTVKLTGRLAESMPRSGELQGGGPGALVRSLPWCGTPPRERGPRPAPPRGGMRGATA